jgi:uncharacterized protein (DUF58 family)
MSRLVLLGSLAYGLLLCGLATLNGGLVALAIPLWVYLGVALFFGPEQLTLSVVRTLSVSRVLQGEPVVVRLSMTNHGSKLEEVLVEDSVPRSLELVGGKPRAFFTLAPGQTVEMEYTVKGKRGRVEFRDVQVTAGDYLGLFRRQAILPAQDRLTILPETSRLRRVAIRPLRTRAHTGLIPSRQGGSGVEFFGVREYQMGDPLRWINWRVSARHPHALFTNEFEQERIADVGLILDARRRSDVRLMSDALFEHAVRAASSLAEALLNDGNRVGLLLYGAGLDWTFPGYGKVQQEHILQALADAETGESQVFDSLDYIPTRYFPARSQIVLISPLWQDDVPMLTRLRARGYQLLVISPDPIAFEAMALARHPTVDLAMRIARLERKLVLQRLQQAGIPIVDWQVDAPLDQAIFASLGKRALEFRITETALWA